MIAWAGLLEYNSRPESQKNVPLDLSNTTCTQRYFKIIIINFNYQSIFIIFFLFIDLELMLFM